ncbi:unnamed protein product [Closterium sp. NIES-54]
MAVSSMSTAPHPSLVAPNASSVASASPISTFSPSSPPYQLPALHHFLPLPALLATATAAANAACAAWRGPQPSPLRCRSTS